MSKKKANGKPVRIFLIDWRSFWLTLGLVLVCIAGLIGMYMLGWDENMIGSVVTLLMALFICVLFLDLGLLLTACITVAEGMVNAGKDNEGHLMIFHADKVERIEVRDNIGNVLPAGQKKYRRVNLTFVMESGRTNPRPMNVLTAKQLQKVREAIGK